MNRAMNWRSFNHFQLLRYTGLFTYFCVGIPLLRYPLLIEEAIRQQRSSSHINLWLASYITFGLVFWFLTYRLGSYRQTSLQRLLHFSLLIILNGTAVSIGYFSQSGLCAMLFVVVAVVLPWLLPLSVGIVWMTLQNFTLVPVFASFPGWSLGEAFLQSSFYLGLSALSFVTSGVAKQQATAREEQRRLNAELHATRALLAESSRLTERMRIARDLHDLVGHHLTALSLNLEVASHLVNDPAQKHVRQAQSIAKLLLADVREVVSQLREEDHIDLSAALQRLVEGVPDLEIHIDFSSSCILDDPKRAQVLLRCTQEIITNTVRHAGATQLWLAFNREGDSQVVLQARDDGNGVSNIKLGNGLLGMRERLAHYGGQLDIVSSPQQGFALDIRLPLEGNS